MSMHRGRGHVAFLVAAFLLASTPVVRAFDLTGTYAGKFACKGVTTGQAGGKLSFTNETALAVKQSASAISLRANGASNQYVAIAIPDPKKPDDKGNIALALCGTDDKLASGTFDEIGRLKVSAKPGALAAKMTGFSIYSDTVAGVLTCKWSFKRTDTVIPAQSTACP
ncbi:MAG: hypothetical protein HY271_14705 [Deltaproteobacteria bacterium]|nr:hypothetical protein [Deltaproteobacteria bacterium]